MKKALITGITGQDGSYLAKFLLDKGYEVYGAFRRASDLHLSRLRYLGIEEQVKYAPVELLEFTNILRLIEDIRPDEVYNLAAQSFVGVSFDLPTFTAEVTGVGALRVLEAIRQVDPNIRLYQASSSEMFGRARTAPQNEETPFRPCSPYGTSKVLAHWSTVNYREAYNMFACCGIMFNHESPLRGYEFVTRKISCAVAAIKKGLQEELVLGNLEARRDWGFAGEYIQAMWLMLQQDTPDEYVIATGKAHSVRDFVDMAFRVVGMELEWHNHGVDEVGVDKKTGRTVVRVGAAFLRPAEVDVLIGDAAKARAKLGWKPTVDLQGLVKMMVESDMKMPKAQMPHV